MPNEGYEDFFDHTNMDYPLGVYYVDLHRMFMEQVRPHWHDAMEIDLLRSGEALFSVGEDEFCLHTGGAVWINQGRLHSIRPANDAECVILSILFHPAYLFEKDDSFLATKYYSPLTGEDAMPYTILDRGGAYGSAALESVNAILEVNLKKAYGFELQTKSLLCALWLQLLGNTAAGNGAAERSLTDEQRVKEAMDYIHLHYAQEIRLEDIAGSINVSKSECCRAFKRSTGETPFDYLLVHRIFESARLMQRSDPLADSMQLLSTSVGFHNASYYNRIFKKYLGVTPTKYREIIKTSHRDALNPYGISLARM